MDTIFALATAQGKAGVAIIRISGDAAFDVASTMCGTLPAPHKAGVRRLLDSDGALIDEALVLTFEDGKSFTGERVVEFHVHGSTAIVACVLAELGSCGQARLAEPGEFTKRALDNNRLDLTQVEGLADLIDAETEEQRKQAIQTLSGALGDAVQIWRKDLIRAASLLEATIDFADEDVPVDVTPEVVELVEKTCASIGEQVKGAAFAERIRSGFEVAILGAPNVGKSTLLNALAGRDAAITSEIAGTTRDVIEVRMDLGGLPVTLLDTAGLRETDDIVEKIGIDRALSRAATADLRVLLTLDGLWPKDLERLPKDIVVRAKCDDGGSGLCVSGLTGFGLDALTQEIEQALGQFDMSGSLATRERHATAMKRAVECMTAGLDVLQSGPDMYDIAAEELRTGIRALNSLIGQVDVESLLDEIFASFCLGK